MTDVSVYRRGATLTFGGALVIAGAMLGGTPVAWADPGADAVGAINDRYAAFGGEGSLLGAPSGDAVDVPGGAERPYAGGAIFYSKDTGAHVMYGAILDRYKALGGPAGSGLGFPKNDEAGTGDGTGRFNDFSDPEGASIYWTPQWGASVVKGRVLEAWRQSGAVTGPFGYPSADTSTVDGVQTGKFVGPEGTEIQWSQAAGLVTIPAALAGKIPGFGATTAASSPAAEGTTSVTKPTLSGPEAPTTAKSSKWWWIPVGIAALALLAGLGRLLRRKPDPEPVRVAPARVPEVKKPTPPPPPAPAPVTKAPAPVKPPAPPRPAPTPEPPPAKVVPLAKVPPPPRQAPTPPPPPAPPAPPAPPVAPAPKAVVHNETEHDVASVIRYESTTPAETTVRVTYENNAVGEDQRSVADKSDSVPDSQQL